MLTREEIKNGNLLFNRNEHTYGIIQDVGNAREKGDRDDNDIPEDEYSYSVVDIISKDVDDGICEHSHITSGVLSIATEKDIDLYLAILEAVSIKKLRKAKKRHAIIRDAMNRFEKLKTTKL